MECSSQAGFLPKYSQKLRALGGTRAAGNFKGGITVAAKMQNWVFCVFPLLKDSLSEQVLERQEWDFLDLVVVSWRFQPNTSHIPRQVSILQFRKALMGKSRDVFPW